MAVNRLAEKSPESTTAWFKSLGGFSSENTHGDYYTYIIAGYEHDKN
jgi:hypothetical protein